MVYVTSDLHGYPLEKFRSLLAKAHFTDSDFCFVLGDVADRGTDGVELYKWLMLQPNIQLIMGNHEAMLMACKPMIEKIVEGRTDELTAEDQALCMNWLQNGGAPTLEAIKECDADTVADIFDFISDAPLYDGVTVGDRDFILTHSGLGNFDKNKGLDDYGIEDLIWNRPELDDKYFDNAITVFGHTPTPYYGNEYKGRAIVTDTWIDIDTGAAMGGSPMLLRLDDLKEFYMD